MVLGLRDIFILVGILATFTFTSSTSFFTRGVKQFKMALVQMFIVTENRIIETKYYVKPTNQILYLHFKSNHPPHTFKRIVYSQALQGIMVVSKEE